MKRLLGLLGLTCLVVLTACFYVGNTFACVLLVVSCVAFAVSLLFPYLRREGSVPVALITAVIAISVFLSYTNFYVEPLKAEYENRKVNVTAAQLSTEDYVNGFYTYKMKVTTVNGNDKKFKIMLRSKAPFNTEPYDIISFPCELRATSKGSDASKGIFLQTYLFDEVDFTVDVPEKKPIIYNLINLRSRLSMSLYKEMDYETASFSNAVFLGDRNAVSPTLRELLRTTGLSHIAVVSGLHLSIIVLICRKIFNSIFHNRIVSGSFIIISIFLFTAITGFGVSIIRSAVMLTIYTVGTMVGRKGDSLNSIGGAALLLLSINPYAVGDIGMLLSFASTIGIVLWSKSLSTYVKGKLNKISIFKYKHINQFVSMIVETISCSLCATVWTLPITILAYKGFSLVSVLSNLLIVPLMTVVLFCIGACIVIHYISFLSVLGDALSFVVATFYDYLVWMCSLLSQLPFSYIHTTESYYYVWLVVSLCLVAVASVYRKRSVTVVCILLSLLTVLSCNVGYRLINRNSVSFYVLDTGYGQSVIIESMDGYAVLSASGTKTKTYLLNSKVETMGIWGNDVLIDTGGYNSEEYCRNLVNEFDYESVLRYHNTNKTSTYELYSENEILLEEQYTLDLWGKAFVEIIPQNRTAFEYVQIGESTVLILPRGIDCEQIPSAYRCADYLIADADIKSSQLLQFKTLITSDSEKTADHSMVPLFSRAEKVMTGSDINFKIKIN